MTDDIEQTEQTEKVEETETVLEEPPFLKIHSTWPGADDRIVSFTLELNLGAEQPIAEYQEPLADGEGLASRSWLIDLVTATIRELRGTGTPPSVVVSGAAMQTALAEHARHIENCDGTCGIRLPTINLSWGGNDATVVEPPETLGHPGSDRWTGGDRKDDL